MASNFQLSFPYGRRNVLAAGESMAVFLQPSDSGAAWASGDEGVFTIEERGGIHYLVGRAPGSAAVRINGEAVAEAIHVVDPERPQRLFLSLQLGRDQARCTVTAGYDPAYHRDVTAEPAVEWRSSDERILRLVEGEAGRLTSEADGLARLAVRYRELEAEVAVDCASGVISSLSDLTADGREFLVAGISTPMSIHFDRSCDGLVRDDGCVQLRAEPGDRVRLERARARWHATGLENGTVIIEAVLGTLTLRREFEVRALPVEISEIAIEGSFEACGARCVFEDETPSVRVQLSAPGYSYIGTRGNIRWSSTDDSIARIEEGEYGPQLICGGKGAVTIRGECLGAAATVEVAVVERPEIQWF